MHDKLEHLALWAVSNSFTGNAYLVRAENVSRAATGVREVVLANQEVILNVVFALRTVITLATRSVRARTE